MEQNNITNWLDDEAAKLTQPTDFEKLPALKLTPNVVTEIDVDISKPFQEWIGDDTKGKTVTKKLIPVNVAGTRMLWWLNKANPLYREIINGCKAGTTKFKVLQTGTQANTKYVLVK